MTTLEGRCLCFPNIYQHQVQPFELKDKSKPGHRKILVFFLSDPAQSVLSTSEIPPQQAEWWQQEVLTQQGTVLSAMPAEVRVYEGVQQGMLLYMPLQAWVRQKQCACWSTTA